MSFALQLEQDSSYKKPQKLFFALFGILFLIAPFYYQPNLGGEGLFIPHNSAIWIVSTWIISTACFIIYRTNEIILPRYWLGLALMPIGAWITGFIAENNNPTEWLVRLSSITGAYLFFLSLFQFRLQKEQINNALMMILLMGIISGTYGLIQISGWGIYFPFIPISPQLSPFGIFQQINIQASTMATILIIALYIASTLNREKNNVFVTLTLLLSCFLASYIIAVSGSRAGLLATILSLPLVIIACWSELTARKTIFVTLILAISIGGYLGKTGLVTSSNKVDRAVSELGGMNRDIRWMIYEQSWELFRESPLIGHGLGSFQKVFQERRAIAQNEGSASFKSAPRFSHPHNEIIFWLVEGGALSVIGIFSAALFTLIQLFKLNYRLGFTLAAFLIPITLHTQVELPFYISNIPWLLLIFLVFLCHRDDSKIVNTNISKAARTTIPLSFFIVSLISSFALVNAQVANAGIVKYMQLKQSQPRNLLPALESLYFREYATYLALRRQLFLGMQGKVKGPAKTYIEWAVNSLKTVPAAQTYRDLVVAYNYLGDSQNAEITLRHALSIYPEHRELLKLKRIIGARDGKLPMISN